MTRQLAQEKSLLSSNAAEKGDKSQDLSGAMR